MRNSIFTATISAVFATIVAPAIPTATVAGEEVGFARHIINPDSEYSACATLDVNRDGKLDIVSGGSWYESPSWKEHKLRDVEMIRGRYDDYSNLPLDVNADGFTDLVSVNYRSKSLYWVQNPGNGRDLWTRHVIDTPGSSETGRLVDIDGDGKMDVLPNGTQFAAWYEVHREAGVDGQGDATWLRHDLPSELIGHGIGCGDINGDGRNDIVSPNGWAEGPEKPRTGRWIWHPEFRLHRDCGLPIVVHDVDGDGDKDLIWGRGHNIGLYWSEQTTDGNGDRMWRQHAIDTSWSEAHSIMLADIDGDGTEDLVAGKRYLGHDGKDPGEYDPLVIYWYGFDKSQKVWHRHLVSWGDDCGFDLDPKCADIDGDGDIDILAAARSGLFLLENLRVDEAGDRKLVSSTNFAAPDYRDRADVMHVRDADGNKTSVATPWDWGTRRAHILGNMEKAMGPLPGPRRRVPLNIVVESETDAGEYIRKKISYAAEPGDRVSAFLLIPKKLKPAAPAMLCLHPTSHLGKAQICGLDGKPSRFYAHELAKRGYVCLAPDYLSFGDLADYDFAKDDYVSGTMKGIWNHIRGIDLLESLSEVDPDRIGCIGHSLGGHNTLFVAAFDQRIRVAVTSCGFNAFEDYYGGKLAGWTSDRYMPRIRDLYNSDPKKMPFDFHEVLAAMAPRPVFINAPLHDSNFAVEGVRKTVASATDVYQLLGKKQNLHAVYPDASHDFPQEIRQQVYEWLDENLK